MEHTSAVWLLAGRSREWLLSHLTQSTDEEQHTLDAWEQQRTKKSSAACGNTREPVTLQRETNTARCNWGESAQLVAPPLGEEENSETHIKHSSFSEGCLRDWFLTHMTQSTDRNGTVWVPGGHRDKTELSGL